MTIECRLYKNFKEYEQIKPGFPIEEIHGGALLGVRSQDFVCFYDWASAQVCSSFRHSCLVMRHLLNGMLLNGMLSILLRNFLELPLQPAIRHVVTPSADR